jgi:uncharacterized protein YjbJ (UPF0337 family)
MNEYRIKGHWNELKGKVKEKWGKLTDDELDRIDGQSDQLIGAIQKHYGRSLVEAQKDVRDWRNSVDC